MPARAEDPETDPTDAPRARRNPAIRRKRGLPLLEASAGMRVLGLNVRAADVVFIKGVIEASEGLAVVFAERGGELTIAAPFERSADLAEILDDLANEVGGEVYEPVAQAGLPDVDERCSPKACSVPA